jgi:hypothetical protein
MQHVHVDKKPTAVFTLSSFPYLPHVSVTHDADVVIAMVVVEHHPQGTNSAVSADQRSPQKKTETEIV